MKRVSQRILLACLLAFPVALLLGHTAEWRGSQRLEERKHFWDELAIATSGYMEHRHPTTRPPREIGSWEGYSFKSSVRRLVLKLVHHQHIQPWQFWRTLARDPHTWHEPITHRPIEEAGRSTMASLGFRLLGGVAPFLILWLGALFASAALAWVILELAATRRFVGAFVLAMLVACSPFVVEALSLYYSPSGFYLVALLALLAFSVHAFLGQPRLGPGLLLRLVGLGCLIAVSTWCRSGVALMTPAIALSVAVAVLRAHPHRRFRWLLVAAAWLVVAIPSLPLHNATRHNTWVTIWEGLGDFDRTKGHTWDDRVVKQILIDAGFPGMTGKRALFSDPGDYTRHTLYFRDLVIDHAVHDPAWLAGILVRRVAVTVTQWKLRPLGGGNAPSFAPRTAANEGLIDSYYSLLTTADQLGLGPWRLELPLPILWLPLVALALVLWIRPAGERGLAWGVVGVVALAAASVPIIVGTGGGIETQSFVIVYFAAAALAFPSQRRASDPARARVGTGSQRL